MNGKQKEKRLLKGYKVREKPYIKARKRAIKERTALSTLIEDWVEAYAAGFEIGIINIVYGDDNDKK